jgi:inner membrane protein
VLWQQAQLMVGIEDLRGINANVVLQWRDQQIPFSPGARAGKLFDSGITAAFQELKPGVAYPFEIQLSLKGSEQLFFVPLGKQSEATITSSWKDPSFTGAFLPQSSDIDASGFTADWKVLHFNRNFPQQWTNDEYDVEKARFGVSLFEPASHYQKSMRSSKYSILIIVLTFLSFFLMEVKQGARIHPLQYILIGLALCLFYTLLLSISEHLGFNMAYLISAVAIITMIFLYTRTTLGRKRIAIFLALALALIYTFLFVLIQMEAYALLFGSIGLFIALGITMYVVRNIQWYVEPAKAS